MIENRPIVYNKKTLEKIKLIIIKNLRNYLKKNTNINSLIIGISGGLDSALVAALCYETINDFDESIKICGSYIGIESNTEEEKTRAIKIGRAFCDDFEVKDFTNRFDNLIYENCKYENLFFNSPEISYKNSVRKGNIKARLRMMYLYDQAQLKNGMVMSTDNFTEYLLGFRSLMDDEGDFGLIQNLWKTEVYNLSLSMIYDYMAAEMHNKAEALLSCYNAIPTDGLGISNSDFDQILVNKNIFFPPSENYKIVDNHLINILNGKYIENDENYIKIKNRYESTHFKRNRPNNISRNEILNGNS